jgi:hypothetical protein
MKVVLKTILIFILITLSVGNSRERNDMAALRVPYQPGTSLSSFC